jgi:integrase
MRVEPITDIKHIKAIKKLLVNEPRDYLLFILGINSGLRAQDLLALNVGDISNCKVGDRVTIKERKTGKSNVIIINQEIKTALEHYLKSVNSKPTDYLFKSRKGANYPLTTFRVTRLVKSWTEALNIKSNTGAHTLRKTWCYMQRTQYGVPWEVLSLRLNHSSPSITRRYLGVKEEEVEQVLLNCI